MRLAFTGLVPFVPPSLRERTGLFLSFFFALVAPVFAVLLFVLRTASPLMLSLTHALAHSLYGSLHEVSALFFPPPSPPSPCVGLVGRPRADVGCRGFLLLLALVAAASGASTASGKVRNFPILLTVTGANPSNTLVCSCALGDTSSGSFTLNPPTATAVPPIAAPIVFTQVGSETTPLLHSELWYAVLPSTLNSGSSIAVTLSGSAPTSSSVMACSCQVMAACWENLVAGSDTRDPPLVPGPVPVGSTVHIVGTTVESLGGVATSTLNAPLRTQGFAVTSQAGIGNAFVQFVGITIAASYGGPLDPSA